MQQRWEGFRDSLRSRHLESDVQRIILPDLSFESAERAFNTWLQTASLPNAIFAATDLVALAILSVLKRQDIKVPSAVSVVGFDDIALASYGAPTLSTIRQNTQLAGEELVNAVLSAIDGRAPKSKIIPVELIMRET
jgi:DNA-binding LacI/PurR family transcriptional regulator